MIHAYLFAELYSLIYYQSGSIDIRVDDCYWRAVYTCCRNALRSCISPYTEGLSYPERLNPLHEDGIQKSSVYCSCSGNRTKDSLKVCHLNCSFSFPPTCLSVLISCTHSPITSLSIQRQHSACRRPDERKYHRVYFLLRLLSACLFPVWGTGPRADMDSARSLLCIATEETQLFHAWSVHTCVQSLRALQHCVY